MLIGRKEELKTLHQALIADESKFVAIYGRRRVGKTFLVREAFNNDFAFYHTGLANETNRIQWQSSTVHSHHIANRNSRS